MTAQESDPPMGLAMAISLVVGTMIGGGIFVLPASLASLGWNAVAGWVVSGAGAICLALTLRLLMKGSGEGFHAVVELTLGPTAAFLAIWAFWTAGLVAIARKVSGVRFHGSSISRIALIGGGSSAPSAMGKVMPLNEAAMGNGPRPKLPSAQWIAASPSSIWLTPRGGGSLLPWPGIERQINRTRASSSIWRVRGSR